MFEIERDGEILAEIGLVRHLVISILTSTRKRQDVHVACTGLASNVNSK